MKKVLCVVSACLLGCSLAASAGDTPLMYDYQLLAKAAPDEMFFGIGNTNNLFIPGGIDLQECIDGGATAKVNQAYVWGLTRAGEDLWFGTGPNVNILVSGTYAGVTNATFKDSRVAEYGYSAFARNGVVPPEMGDWRPADVFVYSLPGGPLVRLNDSLPPAGSYLLQQVVGLRSAGTSAANNVHTNGVVILAGPNLSVDGIIMIAFDAATKTYIDARSISGYINIRKWLKHDDVLYTSVTTSGGDGAVLRWKNDPLHPDYPFAFDVVGALDNGGAELTVHAGRLFVGTWPGIEGQQTLDPQALLNEPAGIYRSPVIPLGGLVSGHVGNWEKVWDIMEYDPDIVCAAVTGIGALYSFEGHLYWGTMQVAGISYFAHRFIHGPYATTEEDELTQELSWRGIAIFRDHVFQERQTGPFGQIILQDYHKPELLYGESTMWQRDLTIHYLFGTWTSGAWTQQPTGFVPLYGGTGFDNLANTYTWTMAVYKDRLFVGTMDAIGLDLDVPPYYAGADLWCFESGTTPARRVSAFGVNNYSSYGIRTMVSSEDGLYLGMANPMNLMTDLTDNLPEGGWELIRLRKIFDDSDWDNLEDGWETEMFGSTTNNVPGIDSDGDTFLDAEEFISGTNPLNSNDYLRLSIQSDELQWAGVQGRLYKVLHKSNMEDEWQVFDVVTGANESVSFDLPTEGLPSGFFRAEVMLDPEAWSVVP